MSRLVDQALAAIGSADPETAVHGIELAISFIEHYRGQIEGLSYDEVIHEPATPADLKLLRDRLVELVRTRPPAQVASAAVFALGKLFDKQLQPFFIEVLRNHLHGDAGVLYQAMIALDNLDVEVFAGQRSMSILDEQLNRELAARFLQQSEVL